MKVKDKEISVFSVITVLVIISGITIFIEPIMSIVCLLTSLIFTVYWSKPLSNELIHKTCKQKTGKDFYGSTKDNFNILLGLNGVNCIIHLIKFFTSGFDCITGICVLVILISIGVLIYMRKDFVDLGKAIL